MYPEKCSGRKKNIKLYITEIFFFKKFEYFYSHLRFLKRKMELLRRRHYKLYLEWTWRPGVALWSWPKPSGSSRPGWAELTTAASASCQSCSLKMHIWTALDNRMEICWFTNCCYRYCYNVFPLKLLLLLKLTITYSSTQRYQRAHPHCLGAGDVPWKWAVTFIFC